MLAHIKPLASKISGTFENNRNEYLMSKIVIFNVLCTEYVWQYVYNG